MNYEGHLAKIASLIRGELYTDEAMRQRYAVDGSIFEILPLAVIVPEDAADVQAILHYLYAQAAAGHAVPSITARGSGSDQAGGPLSAGIVIDMKPRFGQILEITPTTVRVEPGVRYAELQKQLSGWGRYLPPYPASLEICTIGGAVANNSSGEKTVKYGDTRDYIESLKVVLANGEEVLVRALDQTELTAKKSRRTFEGSVYRSVERILHAHVRSSELPGFHVTKNSTGYAVWEIEKRGMFDLAKLFVGSQGTLGIITEITLRTEALPQETTLIAGYFNTLDAMAQAVEELLPLGPSALEIVDRNLLQLVEEQEPGHLKDLLPDVIPEVVLLVEFDDAKQAARSKAAVTILEKYAGSLKKAKDEEEQEKLWKLRRSAAAVIWTVKGDSKPLPIVEDGIVPMPLLPDFFRRAYGLFHKYDCRIAIWGHAGDGNLHMQPFLNLSDAKDREKIWPFVEEFHQLVMEMGGCISAEHNDGMLRSPYLKQQYGTELYGMFAALKQAFDPYNLLNPGKKVGVELEAIKRHLRTSYSLDHLVKHADQINR